MKTLAELAAIRDKMQGNMNIRKEGGDESTRIVVGMATCGIAAGARPVLTAFADEVAKRGLQHVMVVQTGCIGMCKLEPMVEVMVPGQEKVTYCKVTPEMVGRIMSEHIVNGKIVNEYTIGAMDK